jgi:two-component system chemotaxis response regulator CheB
VKPDIIVVGASAGGVETLSKLFEELLPSIPAAFFVTLHLSPFSKSTLPEILSRASVLRAEHPHDGTQVRTGRIYVAPPDYHLMLDDSVIRLGHGPKENRHRPAIDALFRSAARAYGPRVAAVLLSGTLDDGVVGLKEIKRNGGLIIVQDPQEALYPDMPLNALSAMSVDHVLKVREIANKLEQLANSPVGGRAMTKGHHATLANQEPDRIAEAPNNGEPIPLACPECHGPLWEAKDGKLVRYQCLVGHRYTAHSLLAAHDEALEAALWIALRTLEERILLQRRLAEHSATAGQQGTRKTYLGRAQQFEKHARVLRRILEKFGNE